MKSANRGQGQVKNHPSAAFAREAALLAFARERQRRSGTHPAANAPPSDPSILAPGDRVAEHYEVGPIIGAGALGIVYKARHVELGQAVALEVLRPDLARNGSAWRRFEREARALAALHNKHVLRVHDSGTLDSGLRYMVMELLKGCTLREVLTNGPVPPPLAAQYALQVCSALSDAHRFNIIHQDVRPENVFLAKYRAAEPVIKLLGFGTAVFLDDERQHTLTRRTTARPDYLSPEHLKEQSMIDARSDIWSVGMLLYELIAGRTPFFGLNVAQTCLKIASGDISRIEYICPETICPDIPPALAAAIHCCLELNPERRFASVDELALALEPFSRRHGA
jgi:serine/threonine-protein kinase